MIRISRLGLLAMVIAGGFAVPASAQVVSRDPCLYSRDDCEARARERAREAELRVQRLVDERWAREQEAKFRSEFQRQRPREQQFRIRDQQERVREQQERLRDQQQRVREQQLERARDLRERELERTRDRHYRELERAAELRQRQVEMALEQRDRQHQLARDLREREIERAQAMRDATERRRDNYIAPPPGVRFRTRPP